MATKKPPMNIAEIETRGGIKASHMYPRRIKNYSVLLPEPRANSMLCILQE
jgi:hypothetical protein